MRYLVYHNNESFFTNWFEEDNHYSPGMIVFDLEYGKFTDDGKTWKDIEEDHL